LITGASRGIGRAIAERFVAEAWDVTLVARSRAPLDALAATLGVAATAVVCDITDGLAVSALATAEIAAQRTPDVLVNNAGLFPLATLDVLSTGEFEQTMRTNVIGPFALLRAFLPEMKARVRGHVVTIGSVADRAIFAGNGAYAATKHAQRAMHEVLREELRGSGVKATLVSPTATDTPIWDPIDPDTRPGFPPRAAMLGPSDVADAVWWAVTRPGRVNIDEVRLSS
jgi:NADP-dependent 3-hydroxy acid dehydrogenase YdfG